MLFNCFTFENLHMESMDVTLNFLMLIIPFTPPMPFIAFLDVHSTLSHVYTVRDLFSQFVVHTTSRSCIYKFCEVDMNVLSTFIVFVFLDRPTSHKSGHFSWRS